MEQTFLQYGAVGAIALYFIYKDNRREKAAELERAERQAAQKKQDELVIGVLTEIKTAIQTQVDQTKILEETLVYERGHSETYKNSLIGKLETIGGDIKALRSKLPFCEQCLLDKKAKNG